VYIVAFRDVTDHAKFTWPTPAEKQIDILSLLQPLKEVDKRYLLSNVKCKRKLYQVLLDGVQDNVRTTRTIYHYGYAKLHKTIGFSPTIVKWHGVVIPHINDDGVIRSLTHREMFSIQGFNQKTYKLPTQLTPQACFTLAGNAISVPVARLIADQIIASSLHVSV
jgi:site-specific DNA-cytosine methylase